MRGILIFIFPLISFLHPLPAVAGEDSLEVVLGEMERLNQLDPSLAEDKAASVRNFLQTNPSPPDQIRIKALLAPAESLKSGYHEVREALETELSRAYEFEEEPDLVPRVCLAIGDLARRYGDFENGLKRLLEGLETLQGQDAPRLRFRLEMKGAEIYLAGGFHERALAMLTYLEGKADVSEPELAMEKCLLKASTERLLGDVEASRTTLDLAASRFSPETTPGNLGGYWIERIWHALEGDSPAKARRFLDEAMEVGTVSASLRVQAEAMFLSAVLGVIQERREVSDHLETAGKAYEEVAWPARFPEMLERVLALPALRENRRSRILFLKESAVFARQKLNPPARAAGLAARGELAALKGGKGMEASVFSLREGGRLQQQFMRAMGEMHSQWAALEHSPRKSSRKLVSPHQDLFHQLLILLGFIGIVLVLWNRIRVQRHLNQQLENSFEQAKTSEQAAEESNRLKSEFLANVSHEMKTPMGGIVGMASLLEELVSDPRQQQYLATIRTCSENLLVLMNDLLDLGRMESGALEIESHPMEVKTAVGYSVEMVRQAALEKGLALDWELDESVPESVVGDSTRISQVLANLLTNAIKFTESGWVKVGVHFQRTLGSSGNLVFTVSDTGRGMPPQKLETVFEPFERGNAVTGNDPGGSGLGLAICRKLVELMGGTLGARSEEGSGSVFTVILPVKTP